MLTTILEGIMCIICLIVLDYVVVDMVLFDNTIDKHLRNFIAIIIIVLNLLTVCAIASKFF